MSQLRVGSTLCWTAAWLAAVASPVLLLLWPSSTMWWLSGLLFVPLLVLSLGRADSDGVASGGPGDGSWSPPDFNG